MKRFSAMVLALVMVLTSFCSISFAADAPYQENVDIIVKTHTNTLTKGAGPSAYSAGVDGDLTYTNIALSDADIDLFTTGGNASSGFRDLSRIRANVNVSYPVRAGHKYFVKFDARTNVEGTTKAVTGGGDYTRYDFTPAGSTTSVGGDINPYNTYEASANEGWGTVVMNVVPAGKENVADNNRVFLTDGTNKTGYIKLVYLENEIIAIMQQTKAYCGSGFTKQTAYDFTIAEGDICENHTFATPVATGVEGVSYMAANGKKYVSLTEAEMAEKGLSTTEYTSVYGKWSATTDCTPLKCVCGAADCKTTEKIATAKARLKNISADISNIRAVTKGKLYNNDVVKSGVGGKVEVISNPITNEKTVVGAGETKNAVVNDYYDAIIKPVPDEGYSVESIKVDGVAVALADGVYTIPAASASVANEIEVTYIIKVEDYTATRETVDHFLGGTGYYLTGTNKGYNYVTKNGLLQLSLQNSSKYADVGTINEEEGYFEWKYNSTTRNEGEPDFGAAIHGNYSRLYVNFNYKVANNRSYVFEMEMTNPGAADANYPYSQKNAVSNVVAFDPTESIAGSGKGQNISTSAKLAKATIVRTYVPAFKMTNDLGFIRSDSGTSAYYASMPRIEITNEMPYGALPRFYGARISETIKYHNIVASVGEGTVGVTNHTLNYGDETIAVKSGECFGIESGMGADLVINAPNGKVIDTVIWTPVTGNSVDFSEGVKGKVSAEIALEYVTSSGTLFATYKENPVNVQSTYKYITLSANNTLLTNSGVLVSQYPTVLAYDEAGNEYDITGSKFLTIESDNDLVFKAENNRLSTTDNYGFATITATYDNAEGEDVFATVMYQRSANSIFAGNPDAGYIAPNVAGHTAGVNAYSYGHIANYNGYGCRTGLGIPRSLNWETTAARTMVGWFYDAGVEEQKENAFLWSFIKGYYSEDGKYFAYQDSANKTGVSASDKTSYVPATLNAVPRSKGWHQVVVTVDKSGHVLKYIDGILVEKIALTLKSYDGTGTVPESNLEFRCNGKGIYSDLAIVDYAPTKESYAVEFVTENGSVEGNANVAHGATAEYTLVPEAGYEAPATVEVVDGIGLNSKTIPVTNGKFSLIPDDNTVIKVVFAEKADKAPSVSGNTANSSGAYNKTVTGVDGNPIAITAAKSLTAYATIDDGYGYEISEYGIELEKDGKTIALRGMGSRYEGQFAIVAYGAAILAGDYNTRAYVKYVNGENTETVYGQWNAVTVE